MKIKRFRQILTIVMILAALLAGGCSDNNKPQSTGENETADQTNGIRPDNEIRNARISLYDKSVKTVDIQADYIEKYEKQDSTLAWDLEVHFFNDAGAQTSHLVADSGLVREALKLMIANGNVVVVTEDKSRLETEQLFWNGRTEMITTDSFVTIYQRGDTLMGYGLETDQNLNRVKIKRRVSGTLQDTEAIKE